MLQYMVGCDVSYAAYSDAPATAATLATIKSEGYWNMLYHVETTKVIGKGCITPDHDIIFSRGK